MCEEAHLDRFAASAAPAAQTFNPLLPMKWAMQYAREAVSDDTEWRELRDVGLRFETKSIELVRKYEQQVPAAHIAECMPQSSTLAGLG